MTLASEGGHFYDSITGEPRYTVIANNGVERDSTLRDARKHGWVPGSTTIIGCAYRYGLVKWQAEQLLMAGLTLPRLADEPESDWLKRVWADSKEQVKKAAERGTEIHGALECHFAGRPYNAELRPWVEGVDDLLRRELGEQEWKAEKSYAHPLGYGGKADLHSANVLIDFKGKESKEKFALYDEHAQQLAAGAHGLGIPDARCGIVFFDRETPYSELHMVKAEDLARGWTIFCALLAYWKAANRYDPS